MAISVSQNLQGPALGIEVCQKYFPSLPTPPPPTNPRGPWQVALGPILHVLHDVVLGPGSKFTEGMDEELL